MFISCFYLDKLYPVFKQLKHTPTQPTHQQQLSFKSLSSFVFTSRDEICTNKPRGKIVYLFANFSDFPFLVSKFNRKTF